MEQVKQFELNFLSNNIMFNLNVIVTTYIQWWDETQSMQVWLAKCT